MPIGKGYFWSGLADTVKNMYNQGVNESMAAAARKAQEEKEMMEMGERQREFDQLLPKKPDAGDKSLDAMGEAGRGLSEASTAVDNLTKLINTTWDDKIKAGLQIRLNQAQAIKDQRQREYDAASHVALARQNIPVPAAAPKANRKADFLKGLSDALK